MNKPRVLFDASIFIHANYAIMCNYARESEIIQQELAAKIVSQIQKIIFEQFPNHSVVLALDGLHNFRTNLDSTYKAHRSSKNIDKVYINNYLKQNFTCLEFENLEADDIAFMYTLIYPETVLVSEDNDYMLMLDYGRSLYKYKSGNTIKLNSDELLVQRILKIISGDKSDNISKIKLKPIGIKTVQKIFSIGPEPVAGYNLKNCLDELVRLGYISDYDHNYKLIMYDLDTYEEVLGKDYFIDILESIERA